MLSSAHQTRLPARFSHGGTPVSLEPGSESNGLEVDERVLLNDCVEIGLSNVVTPVSRLEQSLIVEPAVDVLNAQAGRRWCRPMLVGPLAYTECHCGEQETEVGSDPKKSCCQ